MSNPVKAPEVKAQLQYIAWRDFLVWCIGEPEVLLRFERETGDRVFQAMFYEVTNGPAPIEIPILNRFTIWCTQTFWGVEDAPQEYHDLIAKQSAANKPWPPLKDLS